MEPVEQHLSSYNFKLDRTALDWARTENVTHVSVEQVCRRERESDLATGERQFDEWRMGRQLAQLETDAAFTYEVRDGKGQ